MVQKNYRNRKNCKIENTYGKIRLAAILWTINLKKNRILGVGLT